MLLKLSKYFWTLFDVHGLKLIRFHVLQKFLISQGEPHGYSSEILMKLCDRVDSQREPLKIL